MHLNNQHLSHYRVSGANPERGFFARSILGITFLEGISLLLSLVLIHLISKHYNYLLFHSVAELFSVVIAVTISLITINCWDAIRNQYIRLIGVTYVFVAILDFLHTISYKGMPIFTDYDYYAPQFWIAARYMESVSMLICVYVLGTRRHINILYLMILYSAVSFYIIVSILYLKTFPICFVAGKGLTQFKVNSEYIISSLFLVSIGMLFYKKTFFNAVVFKQIIASLVMIVLMELCFTLYVSDAMSDAFNEVGHLLKICAFYMVYKAIIVTALKDPMQILFRDLKISETNLLEAQHIARLGQWEWQLVSDLWSWTAEIYNILDVAPSLPPALGTVLDRLSHDDRHPLTEALFNSRATGAPFSRMFQIVANTEKPRFIELKCAPVVNEHGTVEVLRGTLQDVTEQQLMLEELNRRKLSEERIRDSEERFRSTFEQAALGIVHTAFDGRLLRCNDRFSEIIGYSVDEIPTLRFQDLTFPDDIGDSVEKVAALHRGDAATATWEKRYVRKDGSLTWVKLSSSVQRDADGRPLHLITLVEDINLHKKAEEELRLAALVYGTSSEAMIVTDPDGVIISVNPAFTHLTEYPSDEVVGKNTSLLKSGLQDSAFYKEMWDALNRGGRWDGEVWNRKKNGEVYLERLSINTIYDEKGATYRRVGLFSDITEQKKSQEVIWQQANFDTLTGLPNRRMFRDRLAQEIKKARRTSLPLAVMFIDLDRFKEVNDTLGHEKGDLLLQEVGSRLKSCVREGDTVGRLGGDEFTVLISDIEDAGVVDRVAETILKQLAEPYGLGQEVAYVSASVGITLYPSDAESIDGLLKNADQAMYESKHLGRNRFNYFKQDMQVAALTRVQLANDLRVALERNEFELYYQPIVDLATGDVLKAEALIRWKHPKLGLVGPAEFIPIAEETGLIVGIGEWVFRTAANQAAQWYRSPEKSIQISVNKSPVQFRDGPAKRHEWRDYLNALGLKGDSITVEITEGLLLEANQSIKAELMEFREAGIQVSLDDFGTGYSSLSYLKKFDIDYLKIDQSFVRGLAPNSSDLALCEAIIVMAHKLGMKLIAEGIEHEEQKSLLTAAGCDYGQGYLFSRPIPAGEFEKLFVTSRNDAALD